MRISAGSGRRGTKAQCGRASGRASTGRLSPVWPTSTRTTERLRWRGTTLVRAGRDGDVPAGERRGRHRVRHHARRARLRPPSERAAAPRADGGARRATPPEYIHHGLILGPHGGKLSKRDGHSSVADLRDEGLARRSRTRVPGRARPAASTTSSSTSPPPPSRDRRDRCTVRRGARGARRRARQVVPALRGARTLVEAREFARQVLEQAGRRAGCRRAADARAIRRAPRAAPRGVGHGEAREIVRELKAVGGDLRALRLALTGATRGPELWAVLVARARVTRRSARTAASTIAR